ncbi:MAG: PEP-utilizing enzyme [Candidatus Moranbacteria bacterium]|nr:PEP-utilizing enzyme [Candidatus Moranbacteria bacterium]
MKNNKKRKKIIFEKNYTRDCSLVIQGLWLQVSKDAVKEILGEKFSSEVYGFDYLNKGVTEIWENKKLVKKIKAALVKQSFQPDSKIYKSLVEAQDRLEYFRKVWQKKYLSTWNELNGFMDEIEREMRKNLLYTYLGVQETAEKRTYQLAKKMRSEDHFFAYNDRLVRDTLNKLYPSSRSFEVALTVDEIKSGNLPRREMLKKRFDSFFLDSENHKMLWSSKTFRGKYPHYVLAGKDDINFGGVLKGIAASKGSAIGPTRIVRLNREVNKIKKGDMVVASMTTPVLVPGLKKSVGIVTDEGGILCHAGVIARELGIPCVIGTKIATKVLKDGDLVEVDADKGLINILKKYGRN